MPRDREGLYRAHPLLRLKALREGRCPKCGSHPERKTKPYKKRHSGKIVRKAVCPGGHGWEMPYEPEPFEETPGQEG